MTEKKTALLLFIALLMLIGAILIETETIYPSHQAAANDTIANLLAHNGQALPKQQIDLAMLDQNPDIPLTKVSSWHIEQVKLENTVALSEALVDDDPIYHLQANLQITFADGSQATLAWESWRYGLVIGPVVVSKGDGPPGYITAVVQQ